MTAESNNPYARQVTLFSGTCTQDWRRDGRQRPKSSTPKQQRSASKKYVPRRDIHQFEYGVESCLRPAVKHDEPDDHATCYSMRRGIGPRENRIAALLIDPAVNVDPAGNWRHDVGVWLWRRHALPIALLY